MDFNLNITYQPGEEAPDLTLCLVLLLHLELRIRLVQPGMVI